MIMVLKGDAIPALILILDIISHGRELLYPTMSPKYMLLPHTYLFFQFCELPLSYPPLVTVGLVLGVVNWIS